MYYPRTEQQERFLAIAAELAERFAARAAEQDRAGAFPYDNFADIREAGLPALVVPASYGGWNAGLADTVMAMERLAMGDGSTALSLTMHMQTIGSALEEGGWPEQLLEQICRDAVERGALINSIATEPELGSPSRGGKPRTVAQPQRGADGQIEAWLIDGYKSFASMFPVLDYLIVPATLQDGSDDVGRFVVPNGAGFSVVQPWDAMGMRTTGSHTVRMQAVTVPAANLVARSRQSRGGKANAWFMLTISAAYVGVAGAALEAAAAYACQRVPTALGRPIATLESIQRHLGQAELLLHQARLHLYRTAELWEQYPEQRTQLSPVVAAAKVTATNNAVAAVDHCMRVAGGASMTRALPLERYYRDVRGGLSHPIGDDEALVMFGRLATESRNGASGGQ
ncbi:MAG: acyl-CoA/acyl-ACP dehydrogenase [Caldilineaceae bacterium]|nr:acyl-CoA/acyl-ACP dehydrogenase [Caldilineaceae bacterium]